MIIEEKLLKKVHSIYLRTMVDSKPYIITFCSGKSGVGKSILAANIASKLAENRIHTLLCDAHHSSPTLHRLIGVEPLYFWEDLIDKHFPLHMITHEVAPHLTLLASNSSPTKIVTSDEFKASLNTIITNIDTECIIFDCNSGASSEIIDCCAISDVIFVVLTDEPSSVIDAYGLIKIIQTKVYQNHICLIINNVIDHEDADDTTKKLNMATTHFLSSEFESLGFIPYDRAVRSSIIQQQLLCSYSPDSGAALALHELSSLVHEMVVGKLSALQSTSSL